MIKPNHIAALDLGSNSFHLIIARFEQGQLQVLHKEKRKVYLARGLDDENYLDDAAIARGVQTLKEFADTLSGYSQEQVTVVGTYTLRVCHNIAQFLRAAQKVFPYPINVISGQEEARLIYQGVANNQQLIGRTLIIDIGGGSTEFIIGEQGKELALSSRNMGCVTFSDRFFEQGEITKKGFRNAILAAGQTLEPIVARYQKLSWQEALGTSGSVKIISDVIAELTGETNITKAGLYEVQTRLIELGSADAIQFVSVSDDRKGILASALAILIAAFEQLDINTMEYCEFALRDGLLSELSQHQIGENIQQRTIVQLQQTFSLDIDQAQRITNDLANICEQLSTDYQYQAKQRQLLTYAACMLEVGLMINYSGIQKHSAYIIQNTQLPGFNQNEQAMLACLVRFHRKKIKLPEIALIWPGDIESYLRLLVPLRLAVLFNQKRQDCFFARYTIRWIENTISLSLPAEWLAEQSLVEADLHKEQAYLKKCGISLKITGN